MSVAPSNNNNNNNTTTKKKESSDGNAIEKAGSRVRKASLNAVHSLAACIPGTAQTQEALIGKSGMLHEAAEHGNIALVTRYVTNQTNQSSRTIMLSSDYENRNALHKACFNGHVGCVKVLLQHSKILRDNIDIKDRFGCTALYLACIKNTVVLDNGSQATSKEVVEIKLEIVRALLEHNAQPNQAKTTQQATALHWCAIHGFDSVVMELIKTFQKNHDAVELMPLLKQLNSRNDLPMDIVGTELYHLRYRYEEQLINVRGEIQEVTQEVDEPEAKTDGTTKTTKSVERKHRGLIDSPTKNVSYEEVIMRQSSSKLEEVLNRYEACLVAFIAAVSLDPNKDYNVRWLQSMLIWSCYLGLTKNVEDILAVGRRKSVRLSLTWGGISTQDGRTALHFAALMGHDDIIKELNKFYKDPSQKKKFVSIEDMQKKKGCCGGKRDAKHKGFVNYPDHFNNTPIHLCAMQAHFPNSFGATESTASILLEMGADATELNAEGRAPASYARGDVRNLFEKKTKEQQGFLGSCYDSPRVKNEKILSFDWVIRFKNFKANGFKTIKSIDSDHHQLEMKTYLEGKRCLVRLIEDPKKENMLLLFTATEAVCRHHANEMEIELPVINNRVDRTYESHLHFLFEPLRSKERITILKAIIDMEYDLDVFVRSGIMTDYFPMHETTELESVKLRWTRGWFPEPFRTPDDLMNENRSSVMSGLSTIAGYFGEEKAMYFAFVSFYSLYVAYFLVPFGLLISVYQFYFFFKTGSFQGDLDGVYIPIFAVVVSVWATTMVEKWKRKQNELAFRWDCSDVVVEEGFRAQFWGVEKLNPATLTVIKDFPSSTRLKYRCFGYLIVCLMVGIVIAIFLGVRRFKRQFVTIQPPPHDTVWRSLAGVGQGVTIAIMNEIYKIVAEKLTTIENYPTQTLHDNALIYKIFLFQFINGNMALMSAAFLDSDPVALWTLLITLMFGNQIVSLFVNQLMPRLQFSWDYAMVKKAIIMRQAKGVMNNVTSVMPLTSLPSRQEGDDGQRPSKKNLVQRRRKSMHRPKKQKSHLTESYHDDKKTIMLLEKMNAQVLDNEVELGQEVKTGDSDAPIQEGALSEALRNCTMGEDDLLITHYAEMILQFTYVVLWSSVFPLTPVVAVIANAFQIRLEITQLCYYTKRPIPKKEEGIGAWMTIVEIISLIGVVVNSAMIITTFKARDSFQNLFGHRRRHFNISSTNTTLSDSDPLSTDLNFLWVMIAVEHGVIIFKLIIREFIEDKPRWVAEAEIAELADESRAEEMEAELAIQEQQERKKKLRSELNNTKIELAETKKRAASGSNYNAHGVLISRVLATGKDKLKTIQIEEEADKDRQKYQKKIASQEKVADDRVKARLEERKRSREK